MNAHHFIIDRLDLDGYRILANCLSTIFHRRNLDHDKRIFNYRLSRARRIVENAFGRMAAIWRIFYTRIAQSPEKVDSLVLACCALQNYVLRHRTLAYSTDTDAYVLDGTWRAEAAARGGMRRLRPAGGNVAREPQVVRDRFKDYFVNQGAVDWQERMITYTVLNNDDSD